MNFCGQQHNKNRKRDQKHLHVLPKNWAFLSGCRRKQNEGPCSLPLCHSQKVRQQIMGAESGLLFPLGHAFFFLLPPGQMYSKWEPSFYMGGGGGGSGGGEAPPQTPLHSILNWFHIQDTRNFFGESTCETPRNYARQLDNSKLGGRYADI